tara:strand:- start:5463 stop:7595 length:2133 start_codon:yes stop_codon:yes gene_type:complete
MSDDEEAKFNKLLEALGEATESIEEKINNDEFLGLIEKLNKKHPLMYLPDLLNDFVQGDTLVKMLDKHHLTEHSKATQLFQNSLKFSLNQRVKNLTNSKVSDEKKQLIKQENLSHQSIGSRYNELTTLCKNNIGIINSNLIHNVIRAYTILLFFIEKQTIRHDEIFTLLPNIIENHPNLVRSKPEFNPNLKNFIDDKTINQIIHELIVYEHIFQDADDPKLYTISPKYLKIPSLIRNIVAKNENGISYPRLFREVHNKRPLFDLIPNSGLVKYSILELEEKNEIIRKRGLNSYHDQFFIPKEYEIQHSRLEQSIVQQGNKKFFGRKITPDLFISELNQLTRGDFEPEDDQVTRIAGMVLSNARMLQADSQKPPLFDFTVDMSNYQLTPEQLQVLQETDIQLTSNIIHISVMINEDLDLSLIEDMAREIPENQQGLVICFKKIEDENLNDFLAEYKSIQIVDESNFRKWCEITPVIPCRLGAIAKIRYGDNAGQLAQINSINFESGLADIKVFPSMFDTTQYIGSMQEISFSNVDKFRETSNRYYNFLQLLFDASYGDEFKNIILDSQDLNNVIIKRDLESISCTFENHKAEIHTSDPFLASCNCFIWKEFSNSDGLCSHLIYAYNLWFKELIDMGETKITNKMLHELYTLKHNISSPLLEEKHTCPNCNFSVTTIQGLNDFFGTRIINGKPIPQSWCRKCRKQQQKYYQE